MFPSMRNKTFFFPQVMRYISCHYIHVFAYTKSTIRDIAFIVYRVNGSYIINLNNLYQYYTVSSARQYNTKTAVLNNCNSLLLDFVLTLITKSATGRNEKITRDEIKQINNSFCFRERILDIHYDNIRQMLAGDAKQEVMGVII